MAKTMSLPNYQASGPAKMASSNSSTARRLLFRSCLGLAGSLLLDSHSASFAVQPPARSASREPLLVGPTRTIHTLAAAARMARTGTNIEVDAGDYLADVAAWEHDQVTLRAVGGRVRLLANGASAEGKGIWVVRAKGMEVEGFDFEGATAQSRNGAGIRLESGSLRVRDCSFMRNEMGLLTNNDPQTMLEVENCEFAYNQRPDGHNHNLYVGQIAQLSVRGCYLHHARTGHLLKSRAALSHIFYNRLTDEPGGTASYELEFPNGGIAYVVGNIIEQGAQTGNPILISFGAEGYKWPRNEIYLTNNTLVDLLPQGGMFLRVAPGAHAIRAVNNLLVGAGSLETAGPGVFRNNFNVSPDAFEHPSDGTYQLMHTSRLIGKAVDAGEANGLDLSPKAQYVHPRNTQMVKGIPHNPGAMQRTAPADHR